MESEGRYSLDKQERVIKGEPWTRLFNPVVMEVFSDYHRQGGHLFGLTGDLDNLGVYVARNGRPQAENLVDLYNQIIRNFLENWAVENKDSLTSMAFVPSGEEVLIIGVANNRLTPMQLFENVRNGTMSLMSSQPFLDIGDTAASFGGKIFETEHNPSIDHLTSAVMEGQPDKDVFPIYLELMSEIRREMAIELDRHKFRDILGGNYPVEIRQLVLTRMLLYKRTTRQIVESLNGLSKAEITYLLQMLGDIYGVELGKEDEVDSFLNNITKGENDQQQ